MADKWWFKALCWVVLTLTVFVWILVSVAGLALLVPFAIGYAAWEWFITRRTPKPMSFEDEVAALLNEARNA